MNRKLILTADFLNRLADTSLGPEANDAQALQLAMAEAEWPIGDEIELGGLGADDVEQMSSEAWLWLLENAKVGKSRPAEPLVDALFDSSADAIFRLRIADAVLTHPSSEAEHAERRAGGIEQLPERWPKRRLLALMHSEERGDSLAEMAMILLQIGSETSTAVLRALLRDPEAKSVIQPIVEVVFTASGTAREEWDHRLGLNDLPRKG